MSDGTFDTITDLIGIPLVLAAIFVLVATDLGRIRDRPIAVTVTTQVALAAIAIAWIGMRFVYFV